MSDNFTNIVVVDFEYEIDDNLLPNVLCMVVYVLDEHLQHVRTIRMWRGELASRHRSTLALTRCLSPTPR